jgi:hypothetical protein
MHDNHDVSFAQDEVLHPVGRGSGHEGSDTDGVSYLLTQARRTGGGHSHERSNGGMRSA